MSVVLNFIIEETDNARELIFKETTGAYDAVNNTDGWGSPNEGTGDVTSTTLTVTIPSGTEFVYTSAELPGLASFPTTDPSVELSINTEDFGQEPDAQHLDGVYTFRYENVTASATYVVEHKVFVSGKARCCTYKKLASVNIADCNCDSSEKLDALEAFTFYRALIANASSGNEEKYDDLLEVVNKLCQPDNC